jgi:hypothetical protein
MSPSAIDIPTCAVELEKAVPAIGAKAREVAIKAAKIIRAKTIRELSGDVVCGSTIVLM